MTMLLWLGWYFNVDNLRRMHYTGWWITAILDIMIIVGIAEALFPTMKSIGGILG